MYLWPNSVYKLRKSGLDFDFDFTSCKFCLYALSLVVSSREMTFAVDVLCIFLVYHLYALVVFYFCEPQAFFANGVHSGDDCGIVM